MEPYLGQILLVPYNFVPQNWAACDGSLVSISEYEALYTLLGTTFGGDGQRTFGLPDLRSRVPIGVGQGTGLSSVALGQQGGVEQVTLSANQLPLHSHPVAPAKLTIPATAQPGTSQSPGGLAPAVTSDMVGANVLAYGDADGTTTMVGGASASTSAGTPQPQPIELQTPYLGQQYIIAMQGIYPQRPN